jgi:polar amino acid transport system permease protein
MAEKQNSNDVVAVPLRHPWRWVSAAVLVVLLGLFVYSLWASPNINHDVINKYIFNGKVIAAAGLTVTLTVVSMIIGTILAIALAFIALF